MIAKEDILFQKVADALYLISENRELAEQIRRQWEAEATRKRLEEEWRQREAEYQQRIAQDQQRIAEYQQREAQDRQLIAEYQQREAALKAKLAQFEAERTEQQF